MPFVAQRPSACGIGGITREYPPQRVDIRVASKMKGTWAFHVGFEPDRRRRRPRGPTREGATRTEQRAGHMDENQAVDEQAAAATPIFGVYRRGYDPEQVDRYVLDQQRRLDEAIHRASESERKLAAAVGQLRELHRRVAVYESEARSNQPPQLDTLGERVQRILQEAWEGAYNLRQEAERDVTELRDSVSQEAETLRAQAQTDVDELRDVASREAAAIVDEATRRALHIRDETERRRQAYLERVERDREQAIAQITYLYDQRQGAVAELARLQASVQTTVEEMVRSPLGRPAPGVMEAAVDTAIASRTPLPSRASEAPRLPGLMPLGEASGGHDVSIEGDLDVEVDDELPDERDSRAGNREMHLEIPTGPMERFVRPSDRQEARAIVKPRPVAEADEMEQIMRRASRPQTIVSAEPLASGAPASPTSPVAPASPAASTPVRAKGSASESPVGYDSLPERQAGGAASVIQSGLDAAGRILRRPRSQGVYDAEEEGWS